jgi:hypothetical protein
MNSQPLPVALPRMMTVRQKYPPSPALDIRDTIRGEFETLRGRLRPGLRVAVGVGSRGISNLQAIVTAVLDELRAAGAQPFIVPAMGSHGGATPEGQMGLLAEYGVTEQALGVSIRAAMDVERLGATGDGVDVFFSAEALKADAVLPINRVKPHTDFGGPIGSGVLKMLVVGFGKRVGAANYHAAAARLGYELVLRTSAQVSLRQAPVLGAVAIVEDQRHHTARIAVLPADALESREAELVAEARRLMPSLPFEEIDLLIVDRLGKNISGSGMDPNITGRGIHGYASMLGGPVQGKPVVRRLFVRDLTPETHGNAIGIGLADFTTTRLVRAMDQRVTYLNSLTSLTPNCSKIPIHFDTDREAISQALRTLCLPDTRQAKAVRIADTLSLETIEASEAFGEAVRRSHCLERLSSPEEMQFGPDGNLPELVHAETCR